MKAPYFKLEQSEDASAFSKLILADKTPRRYIRSRARYSTDLWVMSDSFIRGVFEKAGKNVEKAGNRVEKYGELFNLFDRNGLPICISVCGDSARVLHADSLFQITAGKIKVTHDPRKLYFAYLDMFPQSALNMSAFVPERKQYFLAPENCLYDSVTTALTQGESKTYFSLNAARVGVTIWKLHKILFELDNCRNVQTVYSAVGKTYGKYATRAEVVNCGEEALSQLKLTAAFNPRLEELLEGIL